MIWLLLLAAVDGKEERSDGDAAGDVARRGGARPRGRGPTDADGAADRPPGDGAPELSAQVEEAQRKLREAIQRNQSERPRRPPQVGQKVDKYFGEKLPPVCERLGCYLTDDGKRYYCVNATCQKHRKRATKHNRIAKRPRGGPTYFRCPRCESRHIDLLMFTDQYQCRRCGHTWDKDMPKPATE